MSVNTERFYGRRQGKPLRPGQKARLERLLPRFSVAGNAALLGPEELFGRPVSDLWLEIGFGGGEHLLAQAEAHPDIGMIGCEPFINGVSKLLGRIEERGIENIRVFCDDVRLLFPRLGEASLGRVFILFADPWPKTRHHKRRIVNRATLDALSRLMKDGAELRIATDHMPYARWILQHVLAHADFEWLAEGPEDWRRRPADWPPTRYERKALQSGGRCVYYRFRRRNR